MKKKTERNKKKVHKEKNENPETPSQCERQHFLADTKRRPSVPHQKFSELAKFNVA